MRTHFRTLSLAVGLGLLCHTLSAVAAENAVPAAAVHGLSLVAPKDRWVARAELRSNRFDRQFDDRGERVANGAEFDAVDIDAGVFPLLALLGPGASLGTSHLSSRVSTRRLEITLGYGFTENFTAGVILPFGRTHNSVDFSVTGGNVGFNPGFDSAQPASPTNPPLLPVGGGAPAPAGTSGVAEILTNPLFGFGYAGVGSSTTSGPGDPTLGFLWRFYHDDASSLVLGSGLRLGVNEEDDPDDLFDVPMDDGSTDLLAQLDYFRNLGHRFDLRLQAKYTYQRADRRTLRVAAPGELLPTAASREELERDLGDYWEYDVELGRSFGDWRLSGTWHRWDKQADRYRSDFGTNTSALEADTAILADQWRLALSWSGINAWRNGHLPLPLIAKLELQETYRGRNMPDVRDLYLVITAVF